MLPWKLRKCQFLPVNQNLSSVHFSLAKFQLVSSNLSLAMIWQMTLNHKLPKLCSATLTCHVLKLIVLRISLLSFNVLKQPTYRLEFSNFLACISATFF